MGRQFPLRTYIRELNRLEAAAAMVRAFITDQAREHHASAREIEQARHEVAADPKSEHIDMEILDCIEFLLRSSSARATGQFLVDDWPQSMYRYVTELCSGIERDEVLVVLPWDTKTPDWTYGVTCAQLKMPKT